MRAEILEQLEQIIPTEFGVQLAAWMITEKVSQVRRIPPGLQILMHCVHARRGRATGSWACSQGGWTSWAPWALPT